MKAYRFKSTDALIAFLNDKATFYEQYWFIEQDPISIPHRFSRKEDIEISAFLIAIIAWGQRVTIINNGKRLVELMDGAPYDFILNHKETDLVRLEGFVHRTFNSTDLLYFIHALREIYHHHGGLEAVFGRFPQDPKKNLSEFKRLFFSWDHPKRTRKHLSDPSKNSSAKRLNMFLRWMVRPSVGGVDFGLWSKVQPKDLVLPLDIHTATVSRRLGLLERKQNDWKSVEAITNTLRTFDAKDPVKYDFALFGIGAYEK